ncbi:MAG: hypothetical protein JNM94_08110 [Phycisphaerae bacterium]|nr:hypothetical protein [Phycisphaerae bacterium]
MGNHAVVALLCCCDAPPPTGCDECDPITITWTGSCTWTGICCSVPFGTSTYSYNKSAYSLTIASAGSDVFEDLCITSQVRFSEWVVPTPTDSCGVENWNFDPAETIGVRLRFHLQGSYRVGWQVTVTAAGEIAQAAPNEGGAIGGWALVFRAPPGTSCPPASGWTYDPDVSNEPLVMTPECDSPTGALNAFVTAFSVGSISVST